MTDESPEAQKCNAFNTFNNVSCTRDEGHSGSHLHVYENGYVCGWPEKERRLS